MNFAFLLKYLKNPMILGGVMAFVIIAYQATRISYLKSKVLKKENALYTMELDLRRCQSVNTENQANFKTLELEYYKITDELTTAKKNQKEAVDFVNNLERESRDKINELQSQIKSNDICFVDAHNVSLLQKANRQN